MKKRIVSMLLAMCLTLTLFPSAALAEEAEPPNDGTETEAIATKPEAELPLPEEQEKQEDPTEPETPEKQEPPAEPETPEKQESPAEPETPTEAEDAAQFYVNPYVNPYAVEGGNIYFDRSSREIVDCDNSVTRADIPCEINRIPVTSIEHDAFKDCSSLTSVTIPSSVTSIHSDAFRDCSSLTSVTIPNSVTQIWSGAFSGCNAVSYVKVTGQGKLSPIIRNVWSNTKSNSLDVELENGITSIQHDTFDNCGRLTSVTIPNSVTSIGYAAFFGCSSLTNATIPNSVTSIGGSAFSGCSSLTSVTIPNSVTSIEYNTFKDCSSLTSVTIPNSVTSIGSDAFSGCSSLTSVTIPNSVTSIGGSAFYGCSSLTSVTIPNSVTSIRHYTFSGCRSLTSVTIPNSVTSIGGLAFSDCSGLTSVTIPNSVTSIEYDAFKDCSSLTSVTIPNSVTSIGSYVFSGCSSLTSVTISNSVTSIGRYAFENCSNLASVTIPNSTIIESNAFSGCDAVSYVKVTGQGVIGRKDVWSNAKNSSLIVEIENGITNIKSDAFSGCSNLTSVTIPNSVTSIGGSAFSGCSSLTSVTIPNSVTSIGRYAFENCSNLASVTIPNSVTIIGVCAFYGCSGLTSVTISNSVTSIYSDAFRDCSSLTSVTIPNSVTSIGYAAFKDCSSLTSVTIPNSVTSIEYDAFYGCNAVSYVKVTGQGELSSITKKIWLYTESNSLVVEIENGITSIGYDAFRDCSSLTSVTIPDSVTSIYSNAFYDCNSLTSVTIPDSVTSIYSGAFFGCSSLTSVAIPNSVTSIGSSAFSGCSSLTSVTIPDSVTSIYSNAFSGCSNLANIYYAGTKEQWEALKVSYLPSTATIHYNHGNEPPISDLEKLNWATADPQYTLAVDEERILIVRQGDGSALDVDRLTWNPPMPHGIIEIVETGRQDENTAYVKIRGVYPGQATLTVTLAPNISAGEDILNRPTVSQIITVISTQDIRFDEPERYVVGCGKSQEIIARVAGLSPQDADKVTWSVGDSRGLSVGKSSKINLGSGVTGLGQVYAVLTGIVAGENSVTLTLPDGRTATIPVTVMASRTTDWSNQPPTASGQIESSEGELTGGVSWKLDFRGVLEFSGTGAIPDYTTPAETPWAQSRDKVRIIKIKPGVSKIGKNAFKNYKALWKVSLPVTLERIEENAFDGDTALSAVEFTGTYPKDWDALMRKTEGGNDPLKNLTRDQITAYSNLDMIPIDESYGVFKHATTDPRIALNAFTSLQTKMKNYAELAKKVTTKAQDEILNESKEEERQRRINAIRNGELKSALDDYESIYLSGLRKETRKAIMDAICLGFADQIDEIIDTKFKIGKIDLEKGKIGNTKLDLSMELITVQIIDSAGRYIDNLLKDREVFKTTASVADGDETLVYKIKVLNSAALGSRILIEAPEGHVQIGGGTAQPFSLNSINGEKLMEQYLGELCGVTKSLLVDALKAYAKYLDDLTDIGSNLKIQSEEDIRTSLGSLFKIFGLEDRTNIVANAYKLFMIRKEIRSVKKKGNSLKFDDLKNAASNIRTINSLSLEDITNKAAQKVISAINTSLENYWENAIFNPGQSNTETVEEIQKALVEDIKTQFSRSGDIDWTINRFGLRCPVDFRIYDSEDNCIGYVENGDVWCEAPVYILVEGDCKDVFLPGGMDVRFEFTGTGQGEMTYVMEEIHNGETTGRRNYYGIPLTEGVSYTQSFHTGDDLQNLQADALTSADGNSIGGSEYLDAWNDTSRTSLYIDCVAEDGGDVTGAGNFAKGDAVTLDAIPDEGKEFAGWYVNGVLVSAENPYQFAALESQEVHAKFRTPYQESERYDVSMGTDYRSVIASVYEDSEGLSHIMLQQMGVPDAALFTNVNRKLYRANHTLYSDETLTADYDRKNGYWLPAVDLRDCAKIELYTSSGDQLAVLQSEEWVNETPITLAFQEPHFSDNTASFTVVINNSSSNDVFGKLIAAAYDGGKLLACVEIPDVEVTSDAELEKQVSLTWRENADNAEIKLFFLRDSWIPLASAVSTNP